MFQTLNLYNIKKHVFCFNQFKKEKPLENGL